jgi:hypothetical protein
MHLPNGIGSIACSASRPEPTAASLPSLRGFVDFSFKSTVTIRRPLRSNTNANRSQSTSEPVSVETGNASIVRAKVAEHRGFFERPQEIVFVQDCVVVDALLIGPVSNPKFPDNREINREFFNFGPFYAILAPNQRANSSACRKIPYAAEQGMFLAEQGIIVAEQGNWTSDQFLNPPRSVG